MSTIHVPFLIEFLAFLLSVVIIVPLFKKVKVSPILGYLTVGTLIGPHSLGIVKDVKGVQDLAELGVVFLLFAIGLELSFNRLKRFSRLIFGFGSAQIILCACAISLVAWLWGNTPTASVIIGLCLALSSTAMVMQLLSEKNELAAEHGRSAFAVLLMQDLAVIPILLLVTALAGTTSGSLGTFIALSFGKAILVIAVIIFLGHFVLRYLFRVVAKTHSIDVFTAMTLLVILATSVATGLAGLSMALGAFLAGVLLAETEFRHQIETEIEPFKGLLLGLFFMGVGMNLDLGVAFQRGIWVILSVIGLIVIKTIIIAALARLFGLNTGNALRTGLILSESGEFAFVVIGQASLHFKLIPIEVGQFMVVVASISMMLTPLLFFISKKLAPLFLPEKIQVAKVVQSQDLHDHVVIAGFGRVGEAIASVLEKQSLPFIAIDNDAENLAICKRKNIPFILGDATRKELLKKTGIDRARVLLVTIDNARAAKTLVALARQHWPELHIIVRAHDDSHSEELLQAGADLVVPELLEASLQLSALVLSSLGLSREEANASVEYLRRDDYCDFKAELQHNDANKS